MKRSPSAPRLTWDLLAYGPLRAIALWAGFPFALQVVSLAVVGALAVLGLGVGPGLDPASLLVLRKTNLTTLVVWGLWWPGMIALTLVFGRVWCTTCPLELVHRAGERLARRLGWRGLRVGKTLRAGWAVVALYVALQILVAALSIHRVPHYTSVFLLVLCGTALATGLFFREPRSFCRAFCPARALLSVYGRYTPAQLEVRDPAICDRCASKACVRALHRDRFDKRSCPSLLRPFRRDPSDGCVLCLQCAKVCPHDNVGVGLVSIDAPVRRRALLRPYEAVFVMVALGFVSHELIGELKWLDAIYHAVPSKLAPLVPSVPFGWIEASWFLGLFPLAVWSLIALAGYAAGHRGGPVSLLLAAATGAAPVVAVAHMAKAVAKIASWAGFLPASLGDPTGLHALSRIQDGSMRAAPTLLDLPVVGWVACALTIFIAVKAWRWVQHVPAASTAAARAGLAGTAVLLGAVLALWGWA